MTVEEFADFKQKSGLSTVKIAEVVNLKKFVLYHWVQGKTYLSKGQMARLESFCEEFKKSNAYMQNQIVETR